MALKEISAAQTSFENQWFFDPLGVFAQFWSKCGRKSNYFGKSFLNAAHRPILVGHPWSKIIKAA